MSIIKKSRFRNKGLWISLTSMLGIVLKANTDIDMGVYNEFVTLLLSAFVAAGIISNPKEGDYYDDLD